MSYIKWFDAHATKHKIIIDKLVKRNYTKEEIVDYFDWENMVKEENAFCPLYKEPKKCHDMKVLNCYLCACPNFRFNDNSQEIINGRTLKSKCSIDNGEEYVSTDVIHQNCSPCSVPHHRTYALEKFSLDWKEMMSESPPKTV